jgi:two-component system, chemotaxis family, chemotaxis protein CheY
MRTLLKTKLKEHNFFVVAEAENGLEAVKKYMQCLPDIVLLDVTMPIMDGMEALKEIIRFDGFATVIMCTSLGQQSLILEAAKIGAKDFVVKPNFGNLIEILNNHVLRSIPS